MGAALSAGALAAQPVRVTVDLSFGKMMQPREHKSLAHQLVRAYGLNRKAPKPLALHFSALALAEAEAPAMLPADGKWRSWPDLERVAAPAAEQWPAERLVWLSPDAEAAGDVAPVDLPSRGDEGSEEGYGDSRPPTGGA